MNICCLAEGLCDNQFVKYDVKSDWMWIAGEEIVLVVSDFDSGLTETVVVLPEHL